MLEKKFRALRSVITLQCVLSACVGLFLLSDLLEGGSRIDVNIGTPIVLVVVVGQLVLGGVALFRFRLAAAKSPRG